MSIYNLILFTPFVSNAEVSASFYSFSYIGILSLIVLLNLMRIFLNITIKTIAKYKLKKLKEAYEKH